MLIHVIPLKDLRDHVESTLCPCEPDLLIEAGEMIFIHNSFDGREALEAAVDILNES